VAGVTSWFRRNAILLGCGPAAGEPEKERGGGRSKTDGLNFWIASRAGSVLGQQKPPGRAAPASRRAKTSKLRYGSPCGLRPFGTHTTFATDSSFECGPRINVRPPCAQCGPPFAIKSPAWAWGTRLFSNASADPFLTLCCPIPDDLVQDHGRITINIRPLGTRRLLFCDLPPSIALPNSL
jgi:hypothetical protein